MACKGLCPRYAEAKLPGNLNYQMGHKRCGSCGMYTKWEGVRCPCCNRVLTRKPKHGLFKKNFVDGQLAKMEARFASMEALQ